MMKAKLIGISGCTNGGKTTLSKSLIEEFPNSYHLSQDDFYHERGSKHYEFKPELNSFNFDVISAIDMKKFHAHLNALVRSGKYAYIFCDGILLYEDDKLNKMLDKKYFIDLNKDECSRRRKSRHYIIEDSSNYFEMCVWKEYQKYKQKCETTRKNVTFLDGCQPPRHLLDHVMNDLNNNNNNNINMNNPNS
jgi:nicotinamide/nicotinate riboside kinase